MRNLQESFDYCVKYLKSINVPVREDMVELVTYSLKAVGQEHLSPSVRGLCLKEIDEKTGKEKFKILIRKKYLFERNDVEMLYGVLCHELIHTAPNCFNHGYYFSKYITRLKGRRCFYC